MSDTYHCDNCDQTFDTAWTDDEAKAEAEANGFDLAGDNVIVCDDCYEKIMAYNVPGWQP